MKRRWPTCVKSIDKLPREVRRDASAHDDATECWLLRAVPVQDAAESFLDEPWWEGQGDYARELARSIKRYGLRNPIVFGPQGFEGHHRLAAVHLLGWETVPAYISRPVSILDVVLEADDLEEPKP